METLTQTYAFTLMEAVEIHSLGEGIPPVMGNIVGVYVNLGDDPASIWIVQVERRTMEKIRPGHPFRVFTVPQACLRKV
jgi:hypothetical protein